MPVITLTSDRKKDDFFLGIIKGKILKECENTSIIDIVHDIVPFDIIHASFVLKHSFKHFPDGTIHLVSVDSEKGKHQKHIVVESNNQYFIGADNGIFSLVLEDEVVDKIVDISLCNKQETKQPAMFDFIHVAKKIIENNGLDNFGEQLDSFKRKFPFNPTFDEDFILGNIIYIDSFLNAITNIDRDLFETIGKNRKFRIVAGGYNNLITEISKSYQEKDEGEALALFNYMNKLEIAINKGTASQLLSLNKDTKIRIEFYDNEISEINF